MADSAELQALAREAPAVTVSFDKAFHFRRAEHSLRSTLTMPDHRDVHTVSRWPTVLVMRRSEKVRACDPISGPLLPVFDAATPRGTAR